MPSNSPPYSYVSYTADGSQTQFVIDFDYLSSAHLSVAVAGTTQTTGFTIDNNTPAINFTTAPAANSLVVITRTTPKSKAQFQTDIADFTDGSILTAADLDQATLGLLYIAQEAQDSGNNGENSLALPLDITDDKWDAGAKYIKDVKTPVNDGDAASKSYVDAVSASTGTENPSYLTVYTFTGNGAQTVFSMIDPVPLNTDPKGYIVEVGGITGGILTFVSAPPAGTNNITVRNIAIQRDYLAQPVIKEAPGDSKAALRVKDSVGSSSNLNLQEWQDTSGSAVANMTNTGDLNVTRLDSTGFVSAGTRLIVGGNTGFGSVSDGGIRANGKIEAGNSQTGATDQSLNVKKLSTFEGTATFQEGVDAGTTNYSGGTGNFNKLGDSRVEANKKLYWFQAV